MEEYTDLKSPIGAILESCALLFDQSNLESFQHELVQNIEEATYSIYDMIDRIHELVRIKSAMLPFSGKPVDLMVEMHRVSQRLKHLIQARGADLVIQPPAEAPLIQGGGGLCPRGDSYLILSLLMHIIKSVIQTVPLQSRIQVDLFHDNPMIVKITYPGNGSINGPEHDPVLSELHGLDLSIILAYMKMTGTEIHGVVTEPGIYCIFIHIPVFHPAVKELADVS